VAQKGQKVIWKDKTLKNSGKTLDQDGLRRLALRYVERYATTRYKLTSYLKRKLHERGWEDDHSPAIADLVERFVDLGYIDDAMFAQSRAASLVRRGYGPARISQALFQAGINEQDSAQALAESNSNRFKAADKFARKRSIGPYAPAQHDRDKCQKQLQAFIRAGHDFEIASRFVFAAPGDDIVEDI
jgi:regulatory protein